MLEFIDVIKWPLALVVCVVIALLMFRSAVTTLLGRANRAGFGKSAIDFSPAPAEQLDAPKTTSASLSVRVENAFPPPMEIYAPIEKEIATTLDTMKYPPAVEKAWLVRAIAANRVMTNHEIVYRMILGSQLELLLAANSASPPDLPRARQIFDAAVIAFPHVYTNFGFEGWLQYVTSTTGFLKWQQLGVQQVLRTTPMGQDFLHYLVSNNLTSPKAG